MIDQSIRVVRGQKEFWHTSLEQCQVRTNDLIEYFALELGLLTIVIHFHDSISVDLFNFLHEIKWKNE